MKPSIRRRPDETRIFWTLCSEPQIQQCGLSIRTRHDRSIPIYRAENVYARSKLSSPQHPRSHRENRTDLGYRQDLLCCSSDRRTHASLFPERPSHAKSDQRQSLDDLLAGGKSRCWRAGCYRCLPYWNLGHRPRTDKKIIDTRCERDPSLQ